MPEPMMIAVLRVMGSVYAVGWLEFIGLGTVGKRSEQNPVCLSLIFGTLDF
jgi:hypothetical protein